MIPPSFVFDLDGTLAHTAPDLVGALNVTLALEDLPPVGLSDVHQLVGRGARVMIERGLKLRGHAVAPERFEDLAAAFFAHYETHIADETVAYDGVPDVLDALADRGAILSVCTNKPERLSLLLLDAIGLRSKFKAICGADTFAVRKPDPLHLTGTIDRAGGNPARAILIGDSPTDRETAKNAGLPCILMDYGYTDIPALELGAEAVLSNFRDVPDAAYRLLK